MGGLLHSHFARPHTKFLTVPRFAEPDWAAVHRELKRPGVTHANIRGPQFFH
jgi:hypothetical protein